MITEYENEMQQAEEVTEAAEVEATPPIEDAPKEPESEPQAAGPVPVDLGEYADDEAEEPEQGTGQTATDGTAEPPDVSGVLSLIAMLIAQTRYKERERQQRFIEAWTAEVAPMMQLLKVPEALAAMGWTAERGLEALPPWVRLALAAAWGVYAFKIADLEARKGVVEGEEIMDATHSDVDRSGI